MMHMFYTKTPSLKILQYLVPFFSGGITLLIYFINVHGLSYLWLILTLLTLIIFSMCVVIFIKDSNSGKHVAYFNDNCLLWITIGYVISIRYLKPGQIMTQILPESLKINLDGLRLFAYLYLITIATDIFAYFLVLNLEKED